MMHDIRFTDSGPRIRVVAPHFLAGGDLLARWRVVMRRLAVALNAVEGAGDE